MRSVSAWDRPVLQSLAPVIDSSRQVHISLDAIALVASWMAYEEFSMPTGAGSGPFPLPADPDEVIDLTLLISALNFAFTDFATGVKFETEYRDATWSDSEAMYACLHAAMEAGVPILDGEYLAGVGRDDLERMFRGNIEMPMLDERVEILNQIGATLVERHAGRFHHFVRSCAPAVYSGGDGLLERLIAEFPRFDDSCLHHGHPVQIHKLAQLCLWQLHMGLHASGEWALRDLEDVTAFADYVVPVALRLLGVFEYHPDLEARINRGDLIERDSEEEIEIRAGTLWATALLTDEINGIRPEHLRLAIPQIDYRLWKTYHATFWPHHLTRTIMY